MQVDLGRVQEILNGIEVPKKELAFAGALFDRNSVRILDVDEEKFAGALLVYHFAGSNAGICEAKLYSARCDMLYKHMSLCNGVVLREGHTDLACVRHSCGYQVCPIALAALFTACADADMPRDTIPLYCDYLEEKKSRSEASEFLKKWGDKLEDSQTALNLLVSEQENDFAGALVHKDRSNLVEFFTDVYSLMTSLGKTEDFVGKDGSRDERIAMMPLLELLASMSAEDDDERIIVNGRLMPYYLFVFTEVGEFVEFAKSAESNFGYKLQLNALFDCLGRIADDRYVLIAGTEGEISDFCSLDKRFLYTFDQHRINLPSMPSSEVFKLYVQYLDRDVSDQIEDMGAFETRFRDYVRFNRDSLPYTGRELADFLAKHANALKRPELPASSYQGSSIDEMLDSVIGLQQVKDTIRDLADYVAMRKLVEENGNQVRDMSLHMLFMGNPGTGKTMMAKMVSTMLYKIGIIKQNKCVEVTAKDLVAGYVGQTALKTGEVIQEAMGGILFIDEAYALTSGGGEALNSFGQEAVDELVKAMDQYKDKLIVILAGYEKEMADFIESNSGLASRIGYKFRFEDYTTDELVQIFAKAMKAQGFTCEPDVTDVRLPELFGYYQRFQNFGNGRFAVSLLSRMIVKHAKALGHGDVDEEHTFILTTADIPTRQEMNNITDWTPQAAGDLLEPLVGIDEIKERVIRLEKIVSYQEQARRRGMRLPDANMHMLFTGNPGTGKTTLARIVGRVLYNVGALPTSKFVEVEARDLARHDPRTGQNQTARYIRDAMNGVLFVDEAYAILQQADADDIIATLVKAMEDHKGEFVVMFAGYQNEMKQFVDRNPGLASRIGYTFHFKDYETDELQEIFVRKAEKVGLKLTSSAKAEARAVFKYFHNVDDFGNGRFVDKFLQELIAKHAETVTDDTIDVIDGADVPTIEEMCKTTALSVYAPSDVDGEMEAIRAVAIHEIGHAACHFALVGRTNVKIITVEAEGNGALGYVQHESGSSFRTAQDLRDEIAVCLAGLAAEELLLGAYGVGGGSDLEQATWYAHRYVGALGLSHAGFVQYVGSLGLRQDEGVHKLPQDVRDAMRELLDEEFARAKDVIDAHRAAFDAMVDALCEKKTITGEEMAQIWKRFMEGESDER